MKFKPCDKVKIYAGKFGRTFFSPSNTLWDDNLGFEGFAVNVCDKVKEDLSVGVSVGAYVLDREVNENITLIVFQPKAKWTINDNVSWKLGVGYLSYDNLEGQYVDGCGKGNSLDARGAYEYDYDAYVVSSELVIKLENQKRISLSSEYVSAYHSDQEAYVVGFNIGNDSVSKKGDWQVDYKYAKIEADAFLATLSDNDFHHGNTGVKGHKNGVKYGVIDDTTLSLGYYKTKTLCSSNKEELVRADVMLGF